MISLSGIEARIDEIQDAVLVSEPEGLTPIAGELLALGEAVLEHWIVAHGEIPTGEKTEGFRLLALHRQGAKGEPSFNACRETCRELVYHHNLLTLDPTHADTAKRLRLMALVTKHLCLFVSGKMQVEGLGEFCCASQPIRANEAARADTSIESTSPGKLDTLDFRHR